MFLSQALQFSQVLGVWSVTIINLKLHRKVLHTGATFLEPCCLQFVRLCYQAKIPECGSSYCYDCYERNCNTALQIHTFPWT